MKEFPAEPLRPAILVPACPDWHWMLERTDTPWYDGAKLSGTPRPNVTMHDQAGVPIVRLQKLLGHASPHMTLRYMKHAPESYF